MRPTTWVSMPEVPFSLCQSVCLSFYLSVFPSVSFHISLTHLSYSISGLLALFLSLSEYLSLCLSLTLSISSPLVLLFPLRITSLEVETIHLGDVRWGRPMCSWPSRYFLTLVGLVGSSGFSALSGSPARPSHLPDPSNLQPFGRHTRFVQQRVGFTSLGLGDGHLPTQKILLLVPRPWSPSIPLSNLDISLPMT